MNLITTIAALALLVFGATQTGAQTASNRLGDCLVQSSTGAQRLALVRWIAFAIVAHPSVRDSVAVPNQVIDDTDKEIARNFTELLTIACRSESRDAMREGGKSIQLAFEVFGRIAMQELMNNPDVDTRIEGFLNHLNEEDFRIFE